MGAGRQSNSGGSRYRLPTFLPCYTGEKACHRYIQECHIGRMANGMACRSPRRQVRRSRFGRRGRQAVQAGGHTTGPPSSFQVVIHLPVGPECSPPSCMAHEGYIACPGGRKAGTGNKEDIFI